MTKKILVTWIGNTDIDVARGIKAGETGPIARALSEPYMQQYASVHILVDLDKKNPNRGSGYKEWLTKRLSASSEIPTIEIHPVDLPVPTDFDGVYRAAVTFLKNLLKDKPEAKSSLVFLLSPGTPTMKAIWILLSRMGYPAELIDTSREKGVVSVYLPFQLAVEYVPSLQEVSAPRSLAEIGLSEGQQRNFDEAFARIRFQSKAMAKAVELGSRSETPHLVKPRRQREGVRDDLDGAGR